MNIRRTLQLGFVLVGMVPAVLLALLAFDRASSTLQHEIEQGLVDQAHAVAADVNRLLVERLQNAATWSRLEVMQDLQVGDVDKRLSDFLQRLQRGYGGLYLRLLARDTRGQVVAASAPALVGQAVTSDGLQRQVMLGDVPITLAWRAGAQGAPPELELRVPVANSFGPAPLGSLHLVVDWAQVDALLDQASLGQVAAAAGAGAAPALASAASTPASAASTPATPHDAGRRQLALVDGQGRLLAASAGLRDAWPRLSPLPVAWTGLAPGTHTTSAGAPWGHTSLLAGVGRAGGFAGFAGFDLKLLVLLPRSEALAPVRNMALIFTVILGGVLVLTLLVSGFTARQLARPVQALTAFARSRVPGQGRARHEPPAVAPGEVGELRDAFVQLLADMEQSQHRLARASALAAVGEMSAILAHEVRTPLGILRSSAQVLRREPALGDEGRELLGFIESETERLANLVSQMLDSARPRAPQLQPCDLNELVRHAVALLSAQAGGKGVSFTLQLDARDPRLQADPEHLTQVLLNLMLNALQILQAGGRIALRTEGDADQLRVFVADDGPGIAPEARSRIFEAFFFQREGGLGLGLAVVQRIVAAHGGDIEAGSSELGGALFTIRLPRRPPVAA